MGKDNLSKIESYDVKGGKVILFGDLHFSATYQGQHKNYLEDCYTNMRIIWDIVEDLRPSCIIFTGDLVGVKETNINGKDRKFLMDVIRFFQKLNVYTNNNVYSVKGNHDGGAFTEFDFLLGLGMIKNPNYINYYNPYGDLELRLHIVNYGEETRKLYLSSSEDDASDIVIGHQDYYIEGVTSWYSSRETRGVELSKLSNFCGVQLVISGHIHIPSEEIVYTSLSDGSSIGLFYLGSPARTAERIDDCLYWVFEYRREKDANGMVTGITDYQAEPMGIPSVEETFYPKEEFIDDDDGYEEKQSRLEESKALKDLVTEIIDSRITNGDLFHQIDVVPNVRQSVKDLAKKYLHEAILVDDK